MDGRFFASRIGNESSAMLGQMMANLELPSEGHPYEVTFSLIPDPSNAIFDGGVVCKL